MTGTVASDVGRVLKRDVLGLRHEIEMFPEDAGLWAVVPGITNSAGTLGLHVAGNIQYFVGAVLGGSGYVRNRDAEFSLRGLNRAEVMAELARAEAEIEPALLPLDDAALAAPFPVALKGIAMPTSRFLIGLAVHTAFHLGQAGYLRRVLTGDATSSDPMPLGPLA